MTEEEMQGRMEFIVEQQAQFTADIQKLQEAQVQLQEAQAKTENVMLRLANALVTVSERQGEFSDAQKQTQIQIDALAERGKETDERLNALINAAERFFSEGRGQ